jgi:hypothetical protein
MTCCHATPAAPTIDLAASCAACPYGGLRSVRCQRGPTLASVTLRGAPCPAGRHPTAENPTFRGVFGIQTRGVAWWTRIWLHALGGPHPDDYAGCGCVDRLKAWLERAEAWALG